MATIEPIKVKGLVDFQRGLRAMDRGLPKALRVALNSGADIVVGYAAPNVPVLTGRAQASLKARSTQTAARVVGGSNQAPHYPWLDFGGRVGRKKSISRPFLKDGRFLYRAYFDHRAEVMEAVQAALVELAESSGIEVDR